MEKERGVGKKSIEKLEMEMLRLAHHAHSLFAAIHGLNQGCDETEIALKNLALIGQEKLEDFFDQFNDFSDIVHDLKAKAEREVRS